GGNRFCCFRRRLFTPHLRPEDGQARIDPASRGSGGDWLGVWKLDRKDKEVFPQESPRRNAEMLVVIGDKPVRELLGPLLDEVDGPERVDGMFPFYQHPTVGEEHAFTKDGLPDVVVTEVRCGVRRECG